MSVLDKNFTTIFHSVKITFISKKIPFCLQY